jgi:hypothetical protein
MPICVHTCLSRIRDTTAGTRNTCACACACQSCVVRPLHNCMCACHIVCMCTCACVYQVLMGEVAESIRGEEEALLVRPQPTTPTTTPTAPTNHPTKKPTN